MALRFVRLRPLAVVTKMNPFRTVSVAPSRNLAHFNRAGEEKEQEHGGPPDFGSLNVQTIGIVGAGKMGAGIAHAVAMCGEYDVLLYDGAKAQLGVAIESLHQTMKAQVMRGQMLTRTLDDIIGRIRTTSDLKSFERADFVIEAIHENADVKATIFGQLSKITRPEVVLASNTAAIPITRIAAATSKPDKVVGMHFMHPAPVMQLVEIVAGLETSEQTVETAHEIAEAMGKTSVRALDRPGFISFRILMPYINEAAHALMEGVGSAKDIDTSIKLGTRSPMGPLELADFIGLDICVAIMRVLQHDLGSERYCPCPLLVSYADAGWTGRAAGRGFHEYPNSKVE